MFSTPKIVLFYHTDLDPLEVEFTDLDRLQSLGFLLGFWETTLGDKQFPDSGPN